MKKIYLLLFTILINFATNAQKILTLDSCRSMAIDNNKELRIKEIDREIAENNKKEAFSKYLPRVNAMGAYVYTSKNIKLISDEQEEKLRNLGTTASTGLQNAKNGIAEQLQQSITQLEQNPLFLQYLQANPQMAQMFQGAMQNYVPQLMQALQGNGALEQSITTLANGVGNGLADALSPNTHNIGFASIMLTQPIYMGGKIAAYNKISDYLLQIEENKTTLANHETIVKVDQAYWQIVALESQKRLAESYAQSLRTLENNLEKMEENGYATKADVLNVKVKLNEAEVTLIQVDNGLALSKMLLCQICGMAFDTDFTLKDANEQRDILVIANISEDQMIDSINTDSITINRPEINSLQLATKVYEEKIKVARAEFLPNVALTGGYTWTIPSSFNGFETKMKGMWTVGVVAKIPIVTCGERLYKTRAAKLEADKQSYQLEENQEKIELQIKQSAQHVIEASKRLNTAQKNLQSAQENLHYANVGLKEGVIPVSDVLLAQTAWLQAQSTMIQAKIDLKLAQLYLDKATGQLNVENY